MNYKLIKNDIIKGKLILKRSYALQIVLSSILFVVGIFMLLAGLALYMNPGEEINSPGMFTGIGMVMLTGGIMLLTQFKIPEQMIFDNSTGRFMIKEKKRDKMEYIAFPYSEIEGFHTRVHKSDNSVYYAVEMEKKDGAFWMLFSSVSEKKAKNFQDEIIKNVTLNNSGSESYNLRENKNFEIIDNADMSLISWKKRYSFFNSFLGALFISSMGLTIYGIGYKVSGSIGYYIAAGFITVISLVFIFNIIYSFGRRYIVEISRDTFKFYSKGGIIRGYNFTIPVNEIESILFNFSTSEIENTIYILRREDKDLMMRIKRGTIGLNELVQAISLMLKVKKLDVGSLYIEDKIMLENILQKKIAQRSGLNGL